MFAADRDWLSGQPGMTPFDKGCRRLVTQMNEWITECMPATCEANATSMAPERLGFLTRVWSCWSWHWKKKVDAGKNIPVDGQRVADTMRGRSPAEPGQNPGVDLVHDVIVVEAVLRGNEAAMLNFQRRFQSLSDGVVSSFEASFRGDRSWQQDTIGDLVGSPCRPGKLQNFVGKGSLDGYLRKIILRKLIACKVAIMNQKAAMGIVATSLPAAAADPTEAAMQRDCQQLFQRVWQQVLKESSHQQLAAMKLIVVDELKQKDAAQVLRVHKGNISRTIDHVIQRVQDLVYDHTGQFAPVYRDCGHLLFKAGAEESRRQLFELFKEEIRRLNREQRP